MGRSLYFTKPAIKQKGVAQLKLQRLGYTITDLDRLFGLQEVGAPRISRQSAHEGGKVVNPTHRPPLPLGHVHCTNFC